MMCRRPVAARAHAQRVEGRLASGLRQEHAPSEGTTLTSARELDLDSVTPTPISPTLRTARATALSTSGSLCPSSGGPKAEW